MSSVHIIFVVTLQMLFLQTYTLFLGNVGSNNFEDPDVLPELAGCVELVLGPLVTV